MRLASRLLPHGPREARGRPGATSLGDAPPPLVEQRALSAVPLEEDPMSVSAVLDSAGRRRSPATMPGYHAGRRETRGCATPPTRRPSRRSSRSCARPGRIATAPGYGQCSPCSGAAGCASRRRSPSRARPRRAPGSLLVRSGKGGRRREIGMDLWGWEQLRPWLVSRLELPIGSLFCIIDGDSRATLVKRRGTRRASPPRRPGQCAAPVCTTPAP